ncbi:MAG: GTP-binding protein [Bulleidia sp.]|nr:GTP-binding protein [Bulleidia sp.]
MTKVDIISGFLGAGKTTLIQKLIKEVFAGQKVVLVENEFGEIGIDGGFLKEAGIVVNEINGGCVCCTLQGDFQEALKKVMETYEPDHIIIEPSGVGKLSDILSIVRSVEGLECNSYSAVVDAKRCKIYHKNFKEFFDDQIATATCVILSRTQECTHDVLHQDVHIIHELNHEAHIITTPWEELTGQAIYDAMTHATDGFPEEEECECCCGHHHHDEDEECCCGHHHHDEDEECCCGHHHHDEDEECCCGHHHHDNHEAVEAANTGLKEGNRIHIGAEEHDRHHHHHHHHHGHDADEVFDSIGIETINTYTEEEIQEALSHLGENIIRAKGIVPTADGWLFFDYVPGDVDIRKGSAAYTGLITVIGEKVDVEEIKALFKVN